MNWPYKLECYITLSLNGLLGTNTLVYWTPLLVTKKINCSEFDLYLDKD